MAYSVLINFSRLALPDALEKNLFRELSFAVQTILNECNINDISFTRGNDSNHRYGIQIIMPAVYSNKYDIHQEVSTAAETVVKKRGIQNTKVFVTFSEEEITENNDSCLSKFIEADTDAKRKKILKKFSCEDDIDFADIFKRCAFVPDENIEKIFLCAGYLATTDGRGMISRNDLFDAIDMYEGKKSDNDFEYIEKLADRFIPTTPDADFNTLVLPEKSMRQINVALALSQEDNLKKYYAWGLDSVDKYPRAILSFYGPPGTGKTHAAQAVAKKLGKKIIIAGCPELKSKYQGESAKNIAAVFYAAQRADAVLFFDEADSLISQRLGEVSSGGEDDINTMKNAILTRLETHKGIVIFATNFIATYDPALETRVQCVEFPAPDLEITKQIWMKKIPSKIPGYETIDFDALGQWSFERGFCGRDIKTAVVNTCKEALYCQVDEVTHEMFLTECKKILDERLNARSANTSQNTLHDVDDDTHAGKSLAEFMEAEAENLKNKFFDDVPYADDLDFAKIVALYSEFQPGEAHRAAHLAKVFAAVDPEQAVVKWEHIEKAAKKIKAAETTSPDLKETLEATVSEIMKNE